MKVKVKNFKVHPRLLFFICICVTIFSLLVKYMKLELEVSLPLLYVVFLLPVAFICVRKHQNNKNILLYLFLAVTVFVEVFRYFTYKDIECLLSVCLLSCIYIIVFNMGIKYQKALFFCVMFALALTVVRAIRSMLIGMDVFAGNRVGIMVAYFWCSLLVLCSKKRALKYGIMLFGIAHVIFTKSRTSLLALCAASILVIYDDVKGRMSFKKLCFLILGLIVASICLYLKLDDIMALLYGKWTSDRSSISSTDVRLMFWGDIMGHRTLIGLRPDYMMSKYGVGNCHNGFVQAYLQFGMIGFVLYILCQIKLTKDALLSESPCKYYILFSLVLSIMESNFWFDSAYPLYPFGVIACWGIIYEMKADSVLVYDGGVQRSPRNRRKVL